MKPLPSLLRRSSAAVLLAALTFAAHATVIGGVDFPQGALSFADAVAAFNPNITANEPSAPHLNATRALGVPDDNGGGDLCLNAATCPYVSLGSGGSITLEFVDNRLTGSGNNQLDLWIFEVGGDVEDTFVSVSMDGLSFTDVGRVFGATAGVDLDAFGFGPNDQFRFVRLRDDPSEGERTGVTVGADIDAVGAISSIRMNNVSAPASALLVLAALALLGITGGHRQRP